MIKGDNSPQQTEDRSKIEELKKSLYSRNAPPVTAGRRLHLRPKDYDVKTDWEHPKGPNENDFSDATGPLAAAASTSYDMESMLDEEQDRGSHDNYQKTHMSFFTKVLIFSILFFLGCAGVGAYLIFGGSDIVSANNIDINLSGPISIEGGSTSTFTIGVSNKNNIALQVVDLTVDYPVGTADPANPARSLRETQKNLPDIPAGGTGQQSISAIIYGQANSQKTIHATVNYRVLGSSATFTKEKDFTILISSSPLTIAATSFTQVTSGQQFTTDITVTSNSTQIIKNLLLKVDFPAGYTLSSAKPNPIDTAHTVWGIGDLKPGGKAVLHLTGSLLGEDAQDKVFNFSVGAAQQNTSSGGIGNTLAAQTLGTVYITGTNKVTIQKPFLSLKLALNGDINDQKYIGAFDRQITGEITWVNNTTDTIIDGEIDLSLSGTAFSKSSVSPGTGFYDSANNRIIWNKITTSQLASIAAGQSGTVSFTLVPRNLGSRTNLITNPSIDLALAAKANRISETNVPEEVDSSINKNVLISSNVALSGQLVRTTGPFPNTGPVPPKAEQETTYTVMWTVYNTSSTLDGVQVGAILPPYVKWLGATSPQSADITYNSNTRQVTWNIGNVSAYATNGSEQVAFQIGVTPGVDLVGQAPITVANATLVARDDFTGEVLTSNIQSMSTRFSTDPSFTDGNETVTQ